MLKGILKSLFVVGVISTLISFAFKFTTLCNPYLVFVISSVIQLFVYYLYIEAVSHFFHIKNKELENARIASFNEQSVEADCAYCRTTNVAPIHLHGDNVFECSVCKKSNGVYINITTTQTTSPLNLDRLSVNTYMSDEEKAIDKIASLQGEQEDTTNE